ncbi:MAG: glycosyl hydrolase family 57 [Magnetococcales bacterium]|nr:glycosyl hydrolase family 57 [Magnetococcales bacterium]
MTAMPSILHDLPNLCGAESDIRQGIVASRDRPFSAGSADFGAIKSAFAIALHMHQPLVPAGGSHLQTAAMISNLQFMLNSPESGDNHNARVFLSCYKRMGEFIPQLLAEGKAPRIMLDYSGTLLHGLHTMGAGDVLSCLKGVTCHPEQRHAIEWLGSPWGHPVAPSTPVQDYRLHVMAWQHHFAAIFGIEALERVRGFSPAEMALPNHPEVAYAFVQTLRSCGYQWVLVQEHSVEDPQTGQPSRQPHLPHRLVCRNAQGESIDIIAIIKTQGSDAKLVGQMQPCYEARGLSRISLQGRSIPPLVTQIADGENGGVMMNEFPSKFMQVMRESSATDTPPMLVSDYLDRLFATGVRMEDLPVVQPLFHKRIWERVSPGDGPERVMQAIAALNQEGHGFHMDGGSWTNNLSWVKGYERVLGPMEEVSTLFHDKVLQPGHPAHEHRYRNALYHLMLSQTSCYRYWGEGMWADYGREICRRAKEILIHDFKPQETLSKAPEAKTSPAILAKEPASKVAKKEPASGVAKKEPASKVAKKEPASGVVKKEPASKVAKKEPASGVAKKEPASKVAKKEPASKVAGKDALPKSVKKETTPKSIKKETTSRVTKKKS